jgi:hypothetical protein
MSEFSTHRTNAVWVKEQVDVLERRRLVEHERVEVQVVEVAVALERGDHHPVERKRGE